MTMTKATKKIIEKYNEWKKEDCIVREHIHEDYDDIVCYFNNFDDMIAIRRDENGNIIEAYEE